MMVGHSDGADTHGPLTPGQRTFGAAHTGWALTVSHSWRLLVHAPSSVLMGNAEASHGADEVHSAPEALQLPSAWHWNGVDAGHCSRSTVSAEGQSTNEARHSPVPAQRTGIEGGQVGAVPQRERSATQPPSWQRAKAGGQDGSRGQNNTLGLQLPSPHRT